VSVRPSVVINDKPVSCAGVFPRSLDGNDNVPARVLD